MSQATEPLRDEVDSEQALDEFSAPSTPAIKGFTPMQVKQLRESLHCSQAVFAHYLHTSALTVRKWELGETRPTGAALKLLNLLADKGLQAII